MQGTDSKVALYNRMGRITRETLPLPEEMVGSMMTARAPSEILDTLERAGYEAYYVGGCVRDKLLGRPIHDWDITTSALPEAVLALFPHCVPTGIAHGTVTVLLADTGAEVTTFRTDGAYRDGRHPDQVTFVRSLREDLARRDFTVNAMAMDRRGALYDEFGGRADLERRLLRAVGDPETRFREDALRMLRALRFSAQLDFSVEPETLAAIGRCASLARSLSAERVRDEVEKTLLSPRPETLEEMISLGLLAAFGLTEHRDLTALAALPETAAVRWAGLCRAYPALDLETLRLPKRLAQDAMAAARVPCPGDRLGWKRLLSAEGESRGQIAAALWNKSGLVQEILASGECLRLRDLAVTGADFPDIHGPALGRRLQALLAYVLEHPEANTRETLLALQPTP